MKPELYILQQLKYILIFNVDNLNTKTCMREFEPYFLIALYGFFDEKTFKKQCSELLCYKLHARAKSNSNENENSFKRHKMFFIVSTFKKTIFFRVSPSFPSTCQHWKLCFNISLKSVVLFKLWPQKELHVYRALIGDWPGTVHSTKD